MNHPGFVPDHLSRDSAEKREKLGRLSEAAQVFFLEHVPDVQFSEPLFQFWRILGAHDRGSAS